MYPYDFCLDGIYYQYGYDKYGDKTKDVVYVCSNGDPTAYSGVIEIPEKVEYNGTTSIVEGVNFNAFTGCVLEKVIFPPSIDAVSGFCNASINEIVIPEGPSIVGSSAFENCRNLKRIHLPVSIKEIGPLSFSGSDIEEINLENVVTISNYAFAYTTIKEVNIDNLTELSEGAFKGCKNLESITLPKTITSIESSVFEDCENLVSIEMSNVIHISWYAFKNCKKLSKINFPATLETIGLWAFNGTQLIDIEFPESLKHIDNFAFSELNSLISVKFGKNLHTIGNGVFECCENLSNVDMSEIYPCDTYSPQDGLNIGDRCFYYCTSLKEISLPKKTRSIGYRAFDYTLLEELDLPEDICLFGIGFWNNNRQPAICSLKKLKSFTFPIQSFRRQIFSSDDWIADYGPFFVADFTESEELENIVVKFMDPTSKQLIYTTFNSVTYEKATLRVPVGTAELYSKCDGWKEFKNIVEDPSIIGEFLVDIDEVFATDNFLNPYYHNGQIRCASNDSTEIEIYDLMGRLIVQIASDNGVADVSNLASGIYVAKIVSSTEVANLKFQHLQR